MSKVKRQPWTMGDGGETDVMIIELTKGFPCAIDMIDKDLAELNWTATKVGNTVYAVRKDPETGKKLLMHRVIIERILERSLEPNEQVDHKNGVGLINRRNNLRLADAIENSANVKKKAKNNNGKPTTSDYKGVSFIQKKNKWCAQISYNRKRLNLGYFDSELEAAKTYDKYAMFFYEGFAKLNFPEDYYDSQEDKENRNAKRQ